MTEPTKPPPRDGERPPSSPRAATPSREPARDTLAPSSFGVLGNKTAAGGRPKPQPARPALNTLGELESAPATATLRPPGAVPPPPRALPQPPSFEGPADEALDVPLPSASPRGALAARSSQARVRAASESPFGPRPATSSELRVTPPAAVVAGDLPSDLESTLDMSGSASKKATQAALIEQTRPATASPTKPTSTVPAPGLFIADEPLEPRPKPLALVTPQAEQLSRMRRAVLVLGGLLLLLAGALLVVLARRSDTEDLRPVPSARRQPTAPTPGCRLAVPPSRISGAIERSVPLSAQRRDDGTLAIAIADAKARAAGWIYDPTRGEPTRELRAVTAAADVTHVVASEPLRVDHALPDFAFARSLSADVAIGVGPAGLLRRGSDGATGVVFTLPAGVRVTAPRVAALRDAYFVVFRQGGAEGQVQTAWLRSDGSALGSLSAVTGTPPSLGTPTAAVFGDRAIALFAARSDKAAPYEIYAAVAAAGEAAQPARKIQLPVDGGGAIAPSLAELSPGRFLLQWTDGQAGQYQVHAVVLGADLTPLGPPLLVSAKGANAGQGSIVAVPGGAVSFFIQTTAGHDELWGATLSCR